MDTESEHADGGDVCAHVHDIRMASSTWEEHRTTKVARWSTPLTRSASTLSANTIGSIAAIPRATGETRALSFNGQMLVMGGGRVAPNPSNEVDIYDPGTNTWTTGSPVPAFATARRNFPTDTDGTPRIWLAGGYDSYRRPGGLDGNLLPVRRDSNANAQQLPRDSYGNRHAEIYTIAKAAPDSGTSTMTSAQTPSNEKEIHFTIRVL